LVGKDARRMTRLSTVIALVGAASSVAAGAAFANAADGVNVPDSTFRQGTGIQEIDISVARPSVGSVEALVIWPLYNSNDHWLVGVVADRSTGARCGYDAGQWQCVPGHSGWHPGDVRVEVSTAVAVDCGPAPGVCHRDDLEVQSIPFGRNPSGASPNGRLISVAGSVVIMPNVKGRNGATSTPSAPASRSSTASGEPATSTSSAAVSPVPAAPSPTVTRSTSAPVSTSAPAAALAPSAKPSPTSIDAENTSSSAPAGPGLPFFAVLLAVILVGVAVPFGYQASRRRRDRP
jgi:hypothetical protein